MVVTLARRRLWFLIEPYIKDNADTVIEITLNKRKSYTIPRSEEVNAIIHGKFLFSFYVGIRVSNFDVFAFSLLFLQINLNLNTVSLFDFNNREFPDWEIKFINVYTKTREEYFTFNYTSLSLQFFR